MYTTAPVNFDQIESYVIFDKTQIPKVLLLSQKVFFYDTCSFQKHAKLLHPEPVFSFIKVQNGIVVLTRCILMELASNSATIPADAISYIQKLHLAGITVLVLYEEDLFSPLETCFSSALAVNSLLAWAISTVQRPTGSVTLALKSDEKLYTSVINRNSADRTLFCRFFSMVRNNKQTGDNLGEELLTICVHLLANLPNTQTFQYLIFTNDKGAVRLIGNAASNSHNQLGYYAFSAITDTKLAQLLYENNFLTEPALLQEFISHPVNSTVRFFGSEEYDLAPHEKNMTPEALSKKIATPGAIYINY